MDPVLKKLQWKPPAKVTVLAAPDDLAPLLAAWSGDAEVATRLGRTEAFVLAFVRSCAEIASTAPKVARAVPGDGLVWFAYPKKSSKRYATDVGRDDSWQPLGELGFEAVRQVAIDADWSALRFRRTEHIASMTRDPARAMSTSGRERVRGT